MFKFSIIMIIVASISLGILIYPNLSHKTPYKYANKTIDVKYEETDFKISNNQIRERIERLVGVKVYWYSEESQRDNAGASNLYFRHVIMDNTISQSDYIETFCHELLHFKYFTTNERFVNYKTFITLYESEFKQVAINMAWEMQNGKVEREYNCLAQICDYLAQ